ncbi:MAG: NAD(P)H-dependent oxidoreductase [Opitutaceae bacterium]|jgi:putative NADPH-quinone reductase
MKISIILSHPVSGSFNHAIANAARDAFMAAGHEVSFHDLHAEGFDPVYSAEEGKRDATLPPSLSAHIDEVVSADGLVVVHPNYWSRPPAMMCGWVDRVLRPGRAYRFVPDGKGGARPEGLLKLRFAAVFNTANTPQENEQSLYGDPLEVHWRKIVFGMCGVPRVERRCFNPVIVSTLEQRRAWLAEVHSLASTLAAETV